MLAFPFFDPTRICPQNLKKLPDLFIGWFSLVPRCHVVARARKKREQNRFIETTDNNKNIALHPPVCIFTVLPVSYTHQPTQHPNATTASYYHLTLSFISLTTLRFITSHSPLFSSLQLLLLLLFLCKIIK